MNAEQESAAELYPLALRLAGRRVLVVGGGAVATRRVPALLAARARVDLVSPVLTPALQGYVDAGRVRWIPRRFVPEDLDGVWLVQVAVDDRFAAAGVSAAALERRIFCVRADDRAAATAWTPAVTRHGPVTVAVLAGGEPRRAMAVRDAIRDGLADGTLSTTDPPPVGAPATDPPPAGASGTDPLPVGAPATDAGATGTVAGSDQGRPDQGRPDQGRLDQGRPDQGGPVVVDPSAPGGSGQRHIRSVATGVPAVGRVALVGAGPGDPELITVKGRRLLGLADVVVADRLVPGLLLDELRPEVELVDASKIPYGPSATQEEINRILVDRALAGRFVVRLKGGDPYVFGRGSEEVIACAEAGVPVTVVPGVTSPIAAPAVAGIPVTHRGVAHELTVVSGHLAPDHPGSLLNWAALASLRGTLVVLMGLKNLAAITDVLARHGRAPQTPAAVVQEGTTGNQRVLRGTLGTIAEVVREAGIRPPAVVVFGDVVEVLAQVPSAGEGDTAESAR